MSPQIHGTTAQGFEAAREVFAQNFAREGDYREIGASFAAFHRGRCVVDLWGGFKDKARTQPWTHDTLANVWSTTKGVTAMAVALLVDRGRLRYEDAVASVWPEFAQNGKANITIAQAMSHEAGLPGFAEPTSVEDQCDWDNCVAKLARQAPAWKPGTASSYHAMTYGWIAGEIVRRASGRSPGRFVQEELAGPLGADVFIGLPASHDARVAEMVPPANPPDMASLPLPDAAKMAMVNPAQDPLAPNTRQWRAAEIPAANGQATAMGLARLYAMLAGRGRLDRVTLLKPETVTKMTAPMTSSGMTDMFLGFVDSWAMGVILNTPGIYGSNKRAFGHSGWGGSFGCTDPDVEVAIGYVCNQMGPDLVGDPRTMGLCAAVIEAANTR